MTRQGVFWPWQFEGTVGRSMLMAKRSGNPSEAQKKIRGFFQGQILGTIPGHVKSHAVMFVSRSRRRLFDS